jgi:hypothetical protein
MAKVEPLPAKYPKKVEEGKSMDYSKDSGIAFPKPMKKQKAKKKWGK